MRRWVARAIFELGISKQFIGEQEPHDSTVDDSFYEFTDDCVQTGGIWAQIDMVCFL